MLIAFTFALIGFEDWSEILRDAQTTNRTLLSQGTASIELIYTPPKFLNEQDVVVQAEVFWHDENLFEKYRFHSVADYPFGRAMTGPIDHSPWDYYLKNDREIAVFNGSSKIVDVRSVGKGASPAILNFHPWHIWLSCCPPTSRSRPWLGMIDLAVKGQGIQRSVHEFHKLGGNLIKHVRRDPSGFMAETTFSLDQGGNVIRYAGINPSSPDPQTHGTYQWRPFGGTFVLDSCEFHRPYAARPGEVEVYRLSVKTVKLQPVDSRVFTRDHLMESIPPGPLQIQDHIAKRLSRSPGKPGVDTGQLRSLSDLLRSRGYAKPD